MAKTFTSGEIVGAISDGKRPRSFFRGRQRAFADAEILPIASRTIGGQARYSRDALIIAVVANQLMDWGLQHPQKLPATDRANPSPSPLWAVARALEPQTLDFIAMGIRRDRDWLIRLDLVPGKDGHPTYLVRPYPITAEGKYGETPDGATSTLSIGLRPLIAHLVGEG